MPAVDKALVVGGGIGGLSAAIALRKAGIDVDLVEIKPNGAVYGVGIIQPNNTLRALDRIGLAQSCVAVGAPFPGWRVHDATGNLLAAAQSTNAAAPQYPATNGITRPRFHKILTDAAEQSGAVIRFNAAVAALEQSPDQVFVEFTDGITGTYDLVVASDGVYSKMRERLFGEGLRSRYAGQCVWRYNLPRPASVEWAALYFGPDTKVGLVPLAPDQMYMLLVTQEPGNPHMPPDQLAPLMRQRINGYNAFINELREQIVDSAAVVYKPLEDFLLPAPWYTGRCIVIGDAAHATTPHLAQGAAMAIEDAVLLGDLLAREAPLDGLLAEFMERRFDRTKFVVDSSAQLSAWELEEWAGVHNPAARPAQLLHEATVALMADY